MKTILIVEDEPLLSSALSLSLSKDGFQILTAVNGNEALNLVNTNKPDLILLDIIMPGISGIDVVKQLKTDQQLNTIPIIILTNLADKDTETTARNLGVVDYLIKAEYPLSDIANKIKTFLS